MQKSTMCIICMKIHIFCQNNSSTQFVNTFAHFLIAIAKKRYRYKRFFPSMIYYWVDVNDNFEFWKIAHNEKKSQISPFWTFFIFGFFVICDCKSLILVFEKQKFLKRKYLLAAKMVSLLCKLKEPLNLHFCLHAIVCKAEQLKQSNTTFKFAVCNLTNHWFFYLTNWWWFFFQWKPQRDMLCIM